MTYILEPYDQALRDLLDSGEPKSTRNGDVLEIFGYQFKIDISKYFPLVTGRSINPRAVWAELLWMMSGSTNIHDLEAMGTKIWSPWIDNDFTERKGYEAGSIGPGYGFQFRHFGGHFPLTSEDYSIQDPEVMGFDQVDYIINELKTNPTSRRILINLWNPRTMTTGQVRLPCCHYSFQLNVANNKLSGMLTMRSNDFFIGCPYNIGFYSAFVYMLAQQCNLVPDTYVHSVGNLHLYKDHIKGAEEYLSRSKPASPKLKLNKAPCFDSYIMSDFELIDYNPLDKITVPVAL